MPLPTEHPHQPNTSKDLPQLDLPIHVGIHSNLALAISKTKDANLQRAASIWVINKSELDWVYTKSEVIRIAQITGKSRLTIDRWLKAGEGIFWYKGYSERHGKTCYYWRGKDAVLRHFGVVTPGTVLCIFTEDLLDPKLKRLRANLKDFVFSNETKLASRETLAELTGVSKRTQQKYDKESGITRQYTTVNRKWISEDGKRYETKQMPNIYHARFLPFYPKTNHKRYGLYTSDFNAKDSTTEAKLDLFAGRLFFDNKDDAQAKADWFIEMGINKDTFYKDNTTRKGNILWNVIEPPMNDLLSVTHECTCL